MPGFNIDYGSIDKITNSSVGDYTQQRNTEKLQ